LLTIIKYAIVVNSLDLHLQLSERLVLDRAHGAFQAKLLARDVVIIHRWLLELPSLGVLLGFCSPAALA
jgi:hypothetical protein